MMDFFILLKTCYCEGISPFSLYSQMCDFCKGDLKLKAQVEVLYDLYRQRDVFHEISDCDEHEGGGRLGIAAYLQRYSAAEQKCLWAVVRLLHEEWTIPSVQSERVERVKVPQRQRQKQGVHRDGFQPQAGFLAAPVGNAPATASPANKPPKKGAARETLHVSNMVSDLHIQTSVNETDFHILTLQNGAWTTRSGGVGRCGANVYINLDGVVADQICLLLPQKKYATLFVDKVHGGLTVEDGADCFEKVRISHESGKLSCAVSARDVFIDGRATEIELNYTALRGGNVDIKTTLGDVRVGLRNVERLQEKVVAVHGNVRNAHTATNGRSVTLKAVTSYGDIEIT